MKKQLSRRDFLRLAGVSGLGLVAASCVAPAQPQPAAAPAAPEAKVAAPTAAPAAEQVKLTMWKAPHKPAGAEVKIAESTLATVTAAHPNITVEYTEIGWDKYGQALTAGYASGNPPDLAYITEDIATYALQNQLENIDPYLDLATGLKDKFYPSSLIPGTINSKLWGLPFGTLTASLLWNKDLFKKRGLDPEKGPATWDDVVSMGKALTSKADDEYGFMIGPASALEWHTWNHVFFPLEAGAKYVNENFTEITLDKGDEALTALTWFDNLFHKDMVTPDPEIGQVQGQLLSMFQAGKGGFALEINTTVDSIRTSAKFDVGIGPFPAGPSSDTAWNRSCYAGVGYLGIASAGKHKNDAWTVAEWLVQPEAQKSWLSKIGFQSVRQDVSFAEGNKLVQAMEANLANGKVENQYLPDKPYRGDVFNEFNNMWKNIGTGQKKPAEALADACQKARDVLKAGLTAKS